MNEFIIYFDFSDGECTRYPVLAICNKPVEDEIIQKIQNEIYIFDDESENYEEDRIVSKILEKFNIDAKIIYPDAYVYKV